MVFKDKFGKDLFSKRKLLSVLGKVFLLLLETVVLLVAALYAAMLIVTRGPSPTARNLFVMTVKETSAIGFLADMCLTQDEIDAIAVAQSADNIHTDTSLITISENREPDKPSEDAWGLIDDDGDGIVVDKVTGPGYSGYMMVVLDPSRVIMGCVPESFGDRGYTVAEMVEKFDAVAGINAGGFIDPNGTGNGSIPHSMLVFEGKAYYPGAGSRQGFAGIDGNCIMHVGSFTEDDVKQQDIRYGVSFGPVLVANSEIVLQDGTFSGLNPRTAIGQRSDGAMLLLVIDGRQAISIGATLLDLAEIFVEYGAVNACNLDGGSSSLMWYQGDYINNCASVIGIRPVPTTFLVLKEGAGAYD